MASRNGYGAGLIVYVIVIYIIWEGFQYLPGFLNSREFRVICAAIWAIGGIAFISWIERIWNRMFNK